MSSVAIVTLVLITVGCLVVDPYLLFPWGVALLMGLGAWSYHRGNTTSDGRDVDDQGTG